MTTATAKKEVSQHGHRTEAETQKYISEIKTRIEEFTNNIENIDSVIEKWINESRNYDYSEDDGIASKKGHLKTALLYKYKGSLDAAKYMLERPEQLTLSPYIQEPFFREITRIYNTCNRNGGSWDVINSINYYLDNDIQYYQW